ncbi:MAG: glycosyltransferase family 39 protein [Candidatus Acidiferrales bacterium]
MSRQNKFFIIFIVAIWAIIYLPALFHPGLLDDADSVHAEAAREMVLRHDWVTLHVNGVRYLDKAPLMYWGVAGLFKTFGVTEWTVRLPLAIGVLGLAWCMFAFGRRFIGETAGFYAALIAVTAPGIYVFTRFLIPDVLVGLWLAAGLYFFCVSYEQETPSRWACWGLAVTAALNVLTKGFIGVIFPGAIIFCFLAWIGDLGFLKKMRLFSSSLVFLAIAAPWHVLAAIRNPAQPTGPEKGFLWFYIYNEQFMRYFNKRIPYDYDKVPLLIFWGLAIAWVIPWSAFLPGALKEIPWKFLPRRSDLTARDRAILLIAVWALIILVFFSFSSRQEYYSLPAVPALALLLGGWLQKESDSALGSRERRAGRIASAAMLGIGIAVFIVMIALVAQTHPFPSGMDIGEVLTQHPGHYKLSLGHMQDLTIESLGLFRAPMWELGVAMLLGTGLNWVFRRRGALLTANLALAGMMVAVLFCVYQGYVIFAPEIGSKTLAHAIEKEYRPGQTIVINRDYEWGSTLNFYTGIQVHLLNGRRNNMWFGSFFPDAPQVFEDNESFAHLWSGPERVYLFSQESLAEEALQVLDPKTVHVFARSGGKVVFTNLPMPMESAPLVRH